MCTNVRACGCVGWLVPIDRRECYSFGSLLASFAPFNCTLFTTLPPARPPACMHAFTHAPAQMVLGMVMCSQLLVREATANDPQNPLHHLRHPEGASRSGRCSCCCVNHVNPLHLHFNVLLVLSSPSFDRKLRASFSLTNLKTKTETNETKPTKPNQNVVVVFLVVCPAFPRLLLPPRCTTLGNRTLAELADEEVDIRGG